MRALKVLLALVLLLISLTSATADPDLLVANWFGGVDILDMTSAALQGTLSEGTQAIVRGPDGDIYVTGGGSNQVVRYNGATGALKGAFTSGVTMNGPNGLAFGGGYLFVNDYWNNRIVRFNGETGVFQNVFYQGGSFFAPTGLALSNGVLYAGSWFGGVVMLDAATSAVLGAIAPDAGSPGQVNFGPDGDLYVADGKSNQVLRYDSATFASEGAFTSGITMKGADGFAFAPDGNLYVADYWNNRILQFDGTTGVYRSVFYEGGSFFAPTYVLAFTFGTVTGTSLTVPHTSGSIGKSTLLKATLRQSGNKEPLSGQSVAFTVDGAVAGTGATSSQGVVEVNFTVPESLTPGSHTLEAVFEGTNLLAGSIGSNTLSISKGSVKIAVAAVTAKPGATVTLKATLKNANSADLIGHTLSFAVNGTGVGTATTVAGGAASMSYTIPAGTQAGTQTIEVTFAGDSLYLSGSGAGKLVVK